MEQFFERCNAALDVQAARKERLTPVVRELQSATRGLSYAMSRIHGACSDEKARASVCEATHSKLKELRPIWKQLSAAIEDSSSEKYRSSWRSCMQDIVFCACLQHWLQHKVLLTVDEVAELIGVDGALQPAGQEAVGISIDLEEYLHGLAGLPKELSRLCVNCVRGQNYTLPKEIAAFVNDLYAGFRLLNLRNDSLRRRFDGMKYDVQRLEEVLYDVQVRGLGAEAGNAGAGSITASSAEAMDEN